MTNKPNREYQIEKFSARNVGRNSYKNYRPFWLPASNYYILTTAVMIAFFFLAWGILHESGEETPWITAGIGASLVLCGAVFLREIVLRQAHNRILSARKRLDYNLKNVPIHTTENRHPIKLSLQQNADIIKMIQQKSDAAKVLGKLSEGHREVFETCNEYLQINKRELQRIGVGSPRLAALQRGRKIVRDLHHFHLLSWTEIESRSLTAEAKNSVSISDKIEMAQKALMVLDSALQFYPQEVQLLESEEALKEFIASIKVSHWIEQAERSAFKGSYKRAIDHYKDALFYLARENIKSEKVSSVAEKINAEIEKLREITAREIKTSTVTKSKKGKKK